MMRGIRSTAVAVTLVALVAACGGSSGKKATPAQDLALAKGAVLTDTDAPTGYTATPHEDSGDPSEQAKRDFANCMKTSFTIFDDAGSQQADGPDFKNDNGGEITNSIEIYPKKSDVDDRYAVLSKSEAEDCLSKLFDTVFKAEAAKQPDASFGAVTVGRFAVDGVGDRATGFRLSVPVTASGQSATAYDDVILAQRGRAALTVTTQAIDGQPDRATAIALAKKMSDRLGQKAP